MNPYEILGLDSNCTNKDIRNVYRELAKKFHPDVGGDPEAFAKISAAVEVLRDPIRRKLFDDHGIYMEESTETLRSMAMNKFRELVDNWVEHTLQSPRDINLPKFLFDQVNQVDTNIKQANGNIDKMMEKLNKRLSQVTCKGERNFIQESILSKLEFFKQAKETNTRDKLIADMIREECKKYSSIEDPVVMQNNMFSGTMFGSGTTSTVFRF